MNTLFHNKKFDARAFRRSHRFASGACGIALLALGAGCDRSTNAPEAVIVVAPRAKGASVKTSSSKTSSTGASGVTVASWFAAVMKQLKEPPRRAKAVVTPRHASADVSAIARRHPAWQLADALERRGREVPAARANLANELSSLHAQSTLRGTQSTLRGAGVFDFGGWRDSMSGARAGQSTLSRANWFGAPNAGTSGARRVMAGGLKGQHERMEQRQQSVLNDFLRDLEAQQQETRDANSATRRAAMNEDIELARRLTLADVAPFLPADPIQLEMTNLRLQLLKNLFATEAERETARERLHQLVRQWENVLRRQESERLNLLTRLRDERPRQIRTQREAEIVTAREASLRRDSAMRAEVWQTQSARIRADFAADTTQLGIMLPPIEAVPFAAPAARDADFGNHAIRSAAINGRGGRDWFGTSINLPSSVAPLEAPAAAQSLAGTVDTFSSGRQAQISALRALAWSDAKQWARIAARRNRTRLQSPKGAKAIRRSQTTPLVAPRKV